MFQDIIFIAWLIFRELGIQRGLLSHFIHLVSLISPDLLHWFLSYFLVQDFALIFQRFLDIFSLKIVILEENLHYWVPSLVIQK